MVYRSINLLEFYQIRKEKKMTQEFTKGVSTRLDEAMFTEITKLAKSDQRTLANMVRVLLTEALHSRKFGVDTKEVLEYIKAKKQVASSTPLPQTPPPTPK